MLGQIFLTSCLFMMTSCWRIDVSEKNVAMQLSLNVTLDCRNHDDNNNNLFNQITKLRILKRNPHNIWISLANVEPEAPHVNTSLQNVILTGNASNLSNSFIKLQFPFATDDAIGQFVCEVEGYYSGTQKEKHLVRTKTEPVVITQREATSQDVMKVIVQFKDQNEAKKVNNNILFVLLQKIIDRYDKDFEQMSNLHDKDIEKMNHLHDKDIEEMTNLKKDFEKINDRTNQLTEGMKSIAKAIPSPVWPSESYTLLQSGTKCPYPSFFDWQFSSVKITTRWGSSNNDRTSSLSHLPPNSFQKVGNYNYVQLRMCSKTATTGETFWPKGRYCISFFESKCPTGFNVGFIVVGRHNDGSSHDAVVNYHYAYPSQTQTFLHYCCRNDGKASNPIELPTRDPFYLYRYGGTCQKVKGMDGSNEWIQFDSNYLHSRRDSRGYYPDSQLKPVKIQLCHYKPNIHVSN